MRIIKIFFWIFIIATTQQLSAQVRYGSCKSTNSYDKFYLMPYAGIGSAKLNSDTLFHKESRFTYFMGIAAHYSLGDRFRIGLGARFQPYSKNDSYGSYIKPYVATEIPLYFDEFSDFGITANAGAIFPTGNSIPQNGFFFDLGLYYNLVVTSTSGIFFGLNYSYNNINITTKSNGYTLNINEFDLLIGYKMWF